MKKAATTTITLLISTTFICTSLVNSRIFNIEKAIN